MGVLRITKLTRAINTRPSTCPRCFGSLVDDCESEFEFYSQRCVLCGYRHELETKNNPIDNSQSINEMEWEF